jgi:hypothetical protein
MTAENLLTLAVALYAAVLSTYLAWFDRRPPLHISVRDPDYRSLTGTHDDFVFRVANRGHFAVTISQFGFIVPQGRRSLRFPRKRIALVSVRDGQSNSLPYELPPGKAFEVEIRKGDFDTAFDREAVVEGKSLKPVPFCIDEAGRMYRGRAERPLTGLRKAFY